MAESSITPEEVQFVMKLLSEARSTGILEIQYKDLKLRLSPEAQKSGSGPIHQRLPGQNSWSTTIFPPDGE